MLFRSLLACLGLASLALAQPAALVAPTDHRSPDEERKSFRLPEGFTAQLVASEPDINKPMQFAFDLKGRLWVPVTVEYPWAAIGRPGKDRLVVLEDFGADGKAKKITTFADELNIPIGVLPLPDGISVLVSSIDPGPPGAKETAGCWIWKLTDTNGDGKADLREKLYGPFGTRDTHGMVNSFTLMPDGWVYACHGFANDSRVKGKDGHEVHMNSGNTFRFRPDGWRIEVYSRGQVNPFGLTHDAWFNFYTADCHSRPMTQNIRGAVYESFGKPHDGIGFGPNMITHGHGSTGLCGLAWYEADHFPAKYKKNMFLGNVVTSRINLDVIEHTGSTPRAVEQPDFLVSGDPWFRPVDIKLGPDGALWVSDFYNKIIGHYEVDLKHPGRDRTSGRIWRIVYTGKDDKPAPAIPDLLSMDQEKLDKLLGDNNLTLRMMATIRLINPTKAVVDQRRENGKRGEVYDVHRMWVEMAEPIGQAQDIVKKMMTQRAKTEGDSLAAAHAYRFQSAFFEWESDRINKRQQAERVVMQQEQLVSFGKESPNVSRAYVDWLTANPQQGHLKTLLAGMASISPGDTHLLHATRIALRELLRLPQGWSAVNTAKLSDVEKRAIADISLAVNSSDSGNFLTTNLTSLAGDAGRAPLYVEHATRYGDRVQSVFEFVGKHKPDDVRLTIAMFKAYARGMQQRANRFDDSDRQFAGKIVTQALSESDPVTLQNCFEVATTFRLKQSLPELEALAIRRDRGDAQRLGAFNAMLAIDAASSVPVISRVLNNPEEPASVRDSAAQSLGQSGTKEAIAALLSAIEKAPARLQGVIAIALAGKPEGADALLKAIASGKASARMLQERALIAKLNESKLPRVGEQIATLTKGLPSADQKMLDLINRKRAEFVKAPGNAKLGQAAFKTNCANCHQLGGEGAKIGPQLDGVGIRGLERLLEDMLDPSRNVDQALRSTTIRMNDGRSLTGLVLREEGNIVVMADALGKEVRLAKNEIDERRSSALSPMPGNFAETIKEEEFRHLLAYLLSQRTKEK